MRVLIYSILLSLAVSLLLGPLVIPALRRLKFGQMVRDDGPQTHLSKAGTPTMGGILILLSVALTSLTLFRGPVEYLGFWTILSRWCASARWASRRTRR